MVIFLIILIISNDKYFVIIVTWFKLQLFETFLNLTISSSSITSENYLKLLAISLLCKVFKIERLTAIETKRWICELAWPCIIYTTTYFFQSVMSLLVTVVLCVWFYNPSTLIATRHQHHWCLFTAVCLLTPAEPLACLLQLVINVIAVNNSYNWYTLIQCDLAHV